MADDKDRNEAPVDPNDPEKPSTAPAEDFKDVEEDRERIEEKNRTPEDDERAKDGLDE